MQIDTFTASAVHCDDPYYSWFQDVIPLGIHSEVAIVSYPIDEPDSFLCRVDCRGGCPSPTFTYSHSIFVTSIANSISFIQGVNIYPNPSQGSFAIVISTLVETDKDAEIIITDLVGQSVLSKPVTLRPGYNKEDISLGESATSGIYIVQLSVDGQSLYYRIVLDK
jgi:hypothetical protein